MKFFLMSALEHAALVKIVTTMWNQSDVRSLILNLDVHLLIGNRLEDWLKIEEKVSNKILGLPLPEVLQEKIKCFVKPIGFQIMKWIEIHYVAAYPFIYLPSEFCWTSNGIIDKKKTAEILITDEKIDIGNRCKIACNYCLESNISTLWNKIPENLRYSFSDPGLNLYLFWEIKMLCGDYIFPDPNLSPQKMFEYSAQHSNKAATEYFFEKLTPEQKELSLLSTAKLVDDAENLCFLLMQIDDENQKQVFQDDHSENLKCFLDWPFQRLFIDIIENGIEFISSLAFFILLCKVVDKIKQGYKDWNYQDIFRILWQASQSHCKTYVIEACSHGRLIVDLLQIDDKQNFKLIIQDASPTQKYELINSVAMKNICESLFFKKDWDLLEFLIHECLSSSVEKYKFKKKLKKRCNNTENLSYNKRKWNQFSLYK